MNINVGGKLRKPKTTIEKDDHAEDGVTKVTTLTIEVVDMDEEDVKDIGRYAAYGQPVTLHLGSPQGDLISFSAGEANG